MRTPTTSAPPSAATPRRRPAAAIACGMLALTTALGLSAFSAAAKGPHLALDAADKLEAEGVDVQWTNNSGGPQTLEAFRANALDLAARTTKDPLHRKAAS